MQNYFYQTKKIWLAFFVGSIMSAATVAQTVSSLEQMTLLNRSGKWEQAAQLAENFLNEKQSKTGEQQCQAIYSLAYAHLRLGRIAKTQAALATYDESCRRLAPTHWISGNVGKLRQEIAAQKITALPAATDGFWQTGDPAALGVSGTVLERHRKLCEASGADACLVVRRGKIVQEFYSPRYRVPMMAMSSTKSVAGLLVGMLIDDGKIKSVDEPVCRYLPEWCAGEKAKVTLRHLLSMTSGLPRVFEKGVGSVGDKNPFVINFPLKFEPGKTWNYSNEGVQLLSPILDKAAGAPVQNYARRRLFEPLGMAETRLHLDSKQHARLYADMETTARDFARIGLLMLNKGKWRNRQIVSEKWVEQSTAPSQNLNPGYGLLWWLDKDTQSFAAQGYLDTDLYVFPQQDLVVVRMQSKPVAGQSAYRKAAVLLFREMIKPLESDEVKTNSGHPFSNTKTQSYKNQIRAAPRRAFRAIRPHTFLH